MSRETKRRLCFWAILALGLGIRLWQFGRVPEGINQDEAFAGLSATSLTALANARMAFLTSLGHLLSFLIIPMQV